MAGETIKRLLSSSCLNQNPYHLIMKKNLILPIFAALLLSVIFVACKKEKDEEVAPTKENLAGTYKLVSLKAKIAGVATEVDAMADYFEPCQKDDLYKLNADLSFQYIDAGSTCDPAGDYEADWSLSGKTISFDAWAFAVTKFDGKTLVGTETMTENGQTITFTGTFQRQ